MFDQEITAAIADQARRIGVEFAALAAVVEVESNGVAFAMIAGRREPLIRFEGHYFYARLKGALRDRAVRLGLANPKAGGVKNPADQVARWKLLNRAAEINAQAALESASYGPGQVMGAHWRMLDYASVRAMVARARASVAGAIELMVRFIEKEHLVGALQRKDWAAFARGYNGKGFAKDGYHKKMARAYARWAASASELPTRKLSARGMLRLGSSGQRVRELQRLLIRAGHSVVVDGDFGTATHRAVRNFQEAMGLEVDGVAGPDTMRALDQYRATPSEQPGAQAAIEIKEVRDGLGGGMIGGGAVEMARRTIVDASYQISNAPALDWLSTGLTVVAGLLALGGLGYAAWGWWKSRQTIEAPDEEVWAPAAIDDWLEVETA